MQDKEQLKGTNVKTGKKVVQRQARKLQTRVEYLHSCLDSCKYRCC